MQSRRLSLINDGGVRDSLYRCRESSFDYEYNCQFQAKIVNVLTVVLGASAEPIYCKQKNEKSAYFHVSMVRAFNNDRMTRGLLCWSKDSKLTLWPTGL